MKTIPLTQGKVALVDDDVHGELSKFKWHAHRGGKTFYARRTIGLPSGRRRVVLMHREVFRLKDEPMPALVDHRDRNGVNNQRSNLRAATNSEQSRNRAKQSNNTSGFIGVSWDKSRRHWQVQVKVNGKQKHLGYFDDPFSAAWFRDQFVKQLDPLAETNHLIDRRKGERRAA